MSDQEGNLKEYVEDYLTAYLLKHVWNNPCTEFRQNLKLRLSLARKATGNIDMYGNMVPLPSGVFYVYECPITRIIGLYPLSKTWMRVSDFINETGLDLRFHGHYGEWLYRRDIHMKVDNGILLFAVSAEMFNDILPSGNTSEVYLSIYKQPEASGKLVLKPSRIFTKAQAIDSYVEVPKHSYTFINGNDVRVTKSDTFKLNDYIEMIIDPDILGTFDINLYDNTHKTFIDGSDGKEKLIIHIPKSFNHGNWLITHNTCDLFLRNKDAHIGVFINRTNTEGDIGQITHNDMYISMGLINEYMEHHGYQEAYLKVVVRRANKKDVLIQDRNYINILYTLSDDEILAHLAGEGDTSFPFWQASVLANSPYVKTMYQIEKPNVRGDLSLYLDTFGYLSALDLVCAKVTHGLVYPYSGKVMLVDIPLSLLHIENITCIAHIDGVKIDFNKYTVVRKGRTIELTFDDSVILKTGTTVAFELFEDIEPRAEYITPTASNKTLQVQGDVNVYQISTIGSSHYPNNMLNQTYGLNKAYELITSGYSITNNIITFNSTLYNKNLLVVSKKGFGTVYTKDFTYDSLNNDIISTALMTASCKQWMSDITTTLPVLWDNFIVYLNGKELAKDIDYTLVDLKTNDNKQIGYVCHINNIDYLDGQNNNRIEVVLIPEDRVIEFNDFSHHDTNDAVLSTLLWFGNISMITSNGAPIRVIDKTESALVLNGDMSYGSLLHTRITLPVQLLELFQEASISSGLSINSDLSRVQLIREFLRLRNKPEYKVSKIEKSHNLYSIMSTLVIRDYLNSLSGTPIINPGDNILNKLSAYRQLESQDVITKNNFNNITVAMSTIAGVNGEYILQGTYTKGMNRVWEYSNNQIKYDVAQSRWVLLTGSTIRFKSTIVVKDYDPWYLIWESVDDSVVPVFTSNALDLRYIDIYPSYRTYDLDAVGGYVDKYKLMVDIISTIFPTDTIQDGVTIQ